MAATAIETPTQAAEAQEDQCVVLHSIGWDSYSRMLMIRGERCVPRMVYLDGSLYLMSPSMRHEHLKERFGAFILEVVVGLDVPCIFAGSTTLRRRVKRGGVEGDQTYYVSNLSRIQGKDKIKLRNDPPPDLAIEVVVSHGAEEAVEVYRRFKVAEVWVCDQSELSILELNSKGRYAPVERSRMLPILTAAEIYAWITRDQDETDTAWIRSLRRWVAEVLVPRHRERMASKQSPAESPRE